MNVLTTQRVLVIGGAGFLSSYLVRKLQERPWVADIIAPRSRDYDLRREAAMDRLYQETRPQVVIHHRPIPKPTPWTIGPRLCVPTSLLASQRGILTLR